MIPRLCFALRTKLIHRRVSSPMALPVVLALATVLTTGCAGIGTAMKASPTLSHSFGIVNIPVADLERQYTNEESEFIKINRYRIHYRDEGQGDPIVLLHDAYSSLHAWDYWASELSSRHRVIRLDLPGFGLTGAPKDPLAFDRASVAKTFADFVDRLELENFHLVGHSLGGEIAAEYAALNSGRVNKLILVAPTGLPRDVTWMTKILTGEYVAKLTNYIHAPIILADEINDAYGDSDRLSKEDGNRYMHMSMRPGSQRMYTKARQFIREQAEGDIPRGLDRVQSPTLLMWGKADSVTPPEHAELWSSNIENSAVVLYPEAGHMPMEEFPQETFADVQRFLSSGLSAFPAPSADEADAEPIASR
ncbi:alpha/beta fold hydrolase [Hydrocarboniclastica marina]|uniref:Alpha/beta hydrolase n=1 Tax=Hydrocarboniclastica marina TaxID=2259620 RepID=A0A4P7XIP5_9ALTE|nr:alpha/beta hydrolase [Hydrocarboniclastica marina]QCF26192.1 alpha/beta hydrolase [Hydrocarboniclastica marina]